MIKECNCAAWKKSWPQIEAAQMLAYTHNMFYDGYLFEYCPWCAKELKEQKQ